RVRPRPRRARGAHPQLARDARRAARRALQRVGVLQLGPRVHRRARRRRRGAAARGRAGCGGARDAGWCMAGRAGPVAGHGYPRPQLERATWWSLNGTWEFAFDPDGSWTRPDQVRWTHTIAVPFAPETPASGIGHQGFFLACWYRRRLTL